MDRDRQVRLGGLMVIAFEGYLTLASFAQLRPVARALGAPDWCRSAAFLAARSAWLQRRLGDDGR